jgi:glucokinase
VLDAAARSIVGPAATGVDLLAAHEAGDDDAAMVVRESGRWLGLGLHNLIVVLDPDIVVLGGAVGAGAGPLVDEAMTHLIAMPGIMGEMTPPPIVPARFETRSGLVGAALMARELTP